MPRKVSLKCDKANGHDRNRYGICWKCSERARQAREREAESYGKLLAQLAARVKALEEIVGIR